MRVVLLTTDTTHHRYFAWRLARAGRLDAIVVETGSAPPPFETRHAFEDERDAYERHVLLAGGPERLADVAPVETVERVAEAAEAVRRAGADLAVVFGTRRLPAEVAATPRLACLNLHGGNPEAYRGLDTHLWAIYHDDFANLVTTLHHVDDGLDTGDLVLQSAVPLRPGMRLHELRAANTEVCVELALLAADALAAGRRLPARRQVARGRYYSSMPAALKDRCVERFDAHVAAL